MWTDKIAKKAAAKTLSSGRRKSIIHSPTSGKNSIGQVSGYLIWPGSECKEKINGNCLSQVKKKTPGEYI